MEAWKTEETGGKILSLEESRKIDPRIKQERSVIDQLVLPFKPSGTSADEEYERYFYPLRPEGRKRGARRTSISLEPQRA